jgi:hypothetical protein
MYGRDGMKALYLENDAYERLEGTVWEIATDTNYLPDWWDTAYITPADRFFVCVADGYGKALRKILTKRQLVVAYLSLKNPTHCGGYHILFDPDACSADLILQQAVLGEIVYG